MDGVGKKALDTWLIPMLIPRCRRICFTTACAEAMDSKLQDFCPWLWFCRFCRLLGASKGSWRLLASLVGLDIHR
jgi:hypothetical protein